MVSSDSAPFSHPGMATNAPLIVFVPLEEQSIEGLAAWLTQASKYAVSSHLRFCFSAASPVFEGVQAELAGLQFAHDWSVLPINAISAFPQALAEVAIRYPGSDIILASAAASFPYAWDARLCKSAYAAPMIAVATAMCDISEMFSLVDENLRQSADAALVDQTAYIMGNRSYYDVPRVHSVCTYLRREALDAVLPDMVIDAISPQATVEALSRRLRAKGWSCVLCDFLYVGLSRPSVKSIESGDVIETSAFLQNNPLKMLRRSVGTALKAGMANVSVPGLDERPVLLHISHFWGGGLEKWVRDFAHVDDTRIHLVFSSFRIGETGGQRLVLYSSPADTNPIRVWDIAQPIRSTVSSSLEYRRIIEQIIREFDVESIIVSSLIGHSLDALDQPVKTIVVCHDYYPICQAINPQFDTTCERCTLDDLRRCAKFNPLNSIFLDQTSDEWHEMRTLYVTKLIENQIEMVAPSPSVVKTLKRLVPRLDAIPMHLIPHGISLSAAALPVATRTAAEPLRIVVLGRLSRHKGTELMRDAAVELSKYAEITLVGCGGNGVKLANACKWNFIEKYLPEELPGILRKLAPHAGLLASVIPETFSYTLSELNQLGIPAIATALGSFNDRIVHGESGFLFQPTKQDLIELIQSLHAKPELLEAMATRLSAQRTGRSLEDMVHDYGSLLPAGSRRVARFRVGIGMQTGLTEPYRQLTEAYAQISDAYAQMSAAYAQMSDAYSTTKSAYEQTEAAYLHANAAFTQSQAAYDHKQSELTLLRGLIDDWSAGFTALEAETHVRRIPEAMQLTLEFQEKLKALIQNGPRNDGSPADCADTKE